MTITEPFILKRFISVCRDFPSGMTLVELRLQHFTTENIASIQSISANDGRIVRYEKDGKTYYRPLSLGELAKWRIKNEI